MYKFIITVILFSSIVSASEFKLKSITGKTYDLNITQHTLSIKQFPDMIIMIDFFSTICPPCIAEFPDLVKFQNTFQDSVRIIGIESASKKDDKSLVKFAKKHELNYPIISLKEADKLIEFALAETNWVGALPYKLLYNDTGTLSYKLYGSMTMKKLIGALEDLN